MEQVCREKPETKDQNPTHGFLSSSGIPDIPFLCRLSDLVHLQRLAVHRPRYELGEHAFLEGLDAGPPA
jgi:hypothetical protein